MHCYSHSLFTFLIRFLIKSGKGCVDTLSSTILRGCLLASKEECFTQKIFKFIALNIKQVNFF
ncbi:hypothetical protein AC26_0179 [Escherichia coli 1-176-05_S3_C2]|nr:hypothetical protein AC26_0179 [Escherichia coli 1-176-05_S3_C2]